MKDTQPYQVSQYGFTEIKPENIIRLATSCENGNTPNGRLVPIKKKVHNPAFSSTTAFRCKAVMLRSRSIDAQNRPQAKMLRSFGAVIHTPN